MPSAEDRLETIIQSEIERSGLTGLAIALVRGGETAWARGYGTANVETGTPVTPGTCFAVMSVTKTIVSTALMQLRDQGRFHLDDPVSKHLSPDLIRNEWEAEAPVTIRQLLTHTSGLPVGPGVEQPGKHSLEDYVRLVAKTERRPGAEIIYANWGFDVIGLLIERFSGLPVDTYLQEHIFGPLEMRSSVLGDPLPGLQAATGHFRSLVDNLIYPSPTIEWNTVPPGPEGAIWSTVFDIGKFVAAHLSGGAPLLTPETTAEMHSLHVRQGDSPSGMGLGFRVTRSNGRRLICHGGDGGGFMAFIGAYPDEGVGVVVLMNTYGMQSARSIIGNEALRLLCDDPSPRALAGAQLTPGLYRSTFWDMEIEARDGDQPVLTLAGGLVVSDPGTESRLVTRADGALQGDGGLFHGFELSFEDGPGGPRLYGGLYPFTFIRVGDIPILPELDETAGLTGAWQGVVDTPMGPMATTLEVRDQTNASVSTPLVSAELENFSANDGRVAGDFTLPVPGLGDVQAFIRLEARGPALAGKVYARSKYGEIAMPARLDQAHGDSSAP